MFASQVHGYDDEAIDLRKRLLFSVRTLGGCECVSISASPAKPATCTAQRVEILGVDLQTENRSDPSRPCVQLNARAFGESCDWRVNLALSSSHVLTLNQITVLLLREYLADLLSADEWHVVVEEPEDAGARIFIQKFVVAPFYTEDQISQREAMHAGAGHWPHQRVAECRAFIVCQPTIRKAGAEWSERRICAVRSSSSAVAG